MIKKTILALASLLFSVSLLAQGFTGGVKGTVINRSDKRPVTDAAIELFSEGEQIARTVSDADGNFLISNIADGMYDMVVTAADFLELRVNVTVNGGYVKNMFNLSLTPVRQGTKSEDDVFTDFDLDDTGYSDSPTILYNQNDVFNNTASFNFSSVRFKTRGYASESQDVMLAGVKMNDAITGYSPFSLWSGLNEATRTKFSVMGNEVSDYGFGGYNGLTNIPVNASNVRKGWRGSLLTNSALYRARVMLTYASGKLDNGWSYALSASARLGGNDWINGVYYRSFGYYASAEKEINSTHKIGMVFMGTPGQRGAQNASTQEVYDLIGDNMYNSNWGYQNGKMRNARVRKTHEPIAILKYDFTPSDRFKGSFTTLYRFGNNGYTALDWYDTFDPRPDYYRNLPSYFYMENSDYNRNNPAKAAWAREMWTHNLDNYAHLDWDKLYNVNTQNSTPTGNRSKYVQEERHVDQNDLNFAANFRWRVTDSLTVTGGASYKWNRTNNYKKIADLLGGDYYVDIDQFAERDYAQSVYLIQNDLDYYLAHGQARVLHKGDKYGYNYDANIRQAGAWINFNVKQGNFDWDVAARFGYTKFWRKGNYRKGLFAGLDKYGDEFIIDGVNLTGYDSNGKVISSLGKSEAKDFYTFGLKSNLFFSFEGGHRVGGSAGYYEDAPTFNQSFVSPRTRNSIVPHLTTTKTFASDITYTYNNYGINFRATGYYTKIFDQSKVMSFYDDSQNSFTNFAMSGIDERHIGIEAGFEVPTFIESLKLVGVFSWGQFVYTSNPYMTQTTDNNAQVIIDNQKVPYWKSHPVFKQSDGAYVLDSDGRYQVEKWQKHYIPSTPQLAASLGLSYFYKYWFIDANVNYFDGSYLDMNPLYRTDMACAGPDKIQTPSEIEYMASQEKFDSQYTVNLSIGKSWYIQRKYQIGFSLNVNNLLNNKDMKTGGYEQTRLVDNTVSKERYYRFDAKYFYMSGINYMLNLYFRF